MTGKYLCVFMIVVFACNHSHNQNYMSNMKSKILLTGATGYIGYNIAKQLLQTGYSLRFFVRNPKDCILGMNAEIITGDIRCYSDVENAVSGCDYVIHAAGLFTFDELRKEEIYDVNVN